MSETAGAPIDDNEQAKQALLQEVELQAGVDPNSMQFDPLTGGLTIPESDGRRRLVMFRAHHRQEGHDHTLLEAAPPRDLNSTRNRMLGSGYYLGNSSEAVELFAWAQDDPEIGVYMTPPLGEDAIIDMRRGADTFLKAAREQARLAINSLRADSKGLARIAKLDEQYGDADAVLLDMGPDTFMGHRAAGQKPSHDVSPVWYLWRADPKEVVRIGSATARQHRNNVFAYLLTKAQERRRNKIANS